VAVALVYNGGFFCWREARPIAPHTQNKNGVISCSYRLFRVFRISQFAIRKAAMRKAQGTEAHSSPLPYRYVCCRFGLRSLSLTRLSIAESTKKHQATDTK
jgi:hypothetical protein